MSEVTTISGLGRFIRGAPSPDRPTGLFLLKNGMQGWQALNARRREALVRALSHGEYDVPVRLPARIITLDCLAIGSSLDDLGQWSLRVSGWGATGERFPLTVDHQRNTLHTNVRVLLADVVDGWERRGRFYATPFQVQFIAADPRKYGEVNEFTTVGGGATVYHRGSFPAHPVIEIPGAPSGYTITSPAGTFTIAGATAGGLHSVDFRTGRVTRNGVWMPNVGRGPLWAVPESTSWAHTLSEPGRVLMTDTYI